jgi:hypothetical protein
MADHSMNDGGDKPVTRRELTGALARFKTEFKTEFKTDLDERFAVQRREISLEIAKAMNFTAERLGAQLERSTERLSREIARASLAGAENRLEIGALDDRYRDLPDRVAVLERGLDEHRRDMSLHRRPSVRRRGD